MVITLYAGILGLMYIGLSVFVILGRFKHQVSLSSRGNADMEKRIRLHGNFIEYVPLALILIFLAEQEGVSEILIHILGVSLIISRFMHAFGLYRVDGTSIGRSGGMILTITVVFVAAFLCIRSYFIF